MKKCYGKSVLVFGTFDGIHDGHRFFLREARKRGGYLIAAVAQDAVVKKLKGKPPRKPLRERLAAVSSEKLADAVAASDPRINSWNILKKYRPDIICLGYDQQELFSSLGAWIKEKNLPIMLATLPSLATDSFHSRLLRKK